MFSSPQCINIILQSSRYQVEGLAAGDMEFKQAMDKMPSPKGPKKVGYQGTQSIIGLINILMKWTLQKSSYVLYFTKMRST